ncbi:MAG: hypothetical protein JW825_05765 [Candidatus Methanofastidiosa archaeon]|nr:hypothetical protein [Candidatus Methanofastidiosa archaeon]
MRHLHLSIALALGLVMLLSLPMISADFANLRYDDGDPDGAVRLGSSGPSEYATRFTINNPGHATCVYINYLSTGACNDVTVQFYNATEGPGAFLVPGTPISDAYPIPMQNTGIFLPGLWAQVPVDVMLPAGDFFVVVRNPRASSVPPDVYFCYDFWSVEDDLYRFLYRWVPNECQTSYEVWYFRVDVITNDVSPFATLKPLMNTYLEKLNNAWDCLLSQLPAEPSDELDVLFSSLQAHMNNAMSISNPIFVMGELSKALDVMSQIEAEMQISCIEN